MRSDDKGVNYYGVLGVGRDATQQQITAAYRRLAPASHPDHRPAEQKVAAEEEFKRIQQAYEVLTNDHVKKAYDKWLPTSDSGSFLAATNAAQEALGQDAQQTVRQSSSAAASQSFVEAPIDSLIVQLNGYLELACIHIKNSSGLEYSQTIESIFGVIDKYCTMPSKLNEEVLTKLLFALREKLTEKELDICSHTMLSPFLKLISTKPLNESTVLLKALLKTNGDKNTHKINPYILFAALTLTKVDKEPLICKFGKNSELSEILLKNILFMKPEKGWGFKQCCFVESSDYQKENGEELINLIRSTIKSTKFDVKPFIALAIIEVEKAKDEDTLKKIYEIFCQNPDKIVELIRFMREDGAIKQMRNATLSFVGMAIAEAKKTNDAKTLKAIYRIQAEDGSILREKHAVEVPKTASAASAAAASSVNSPSFFPTPAKQSGDKHDPLKQKIETQLEILGKAFETDSAVKDLELHQQKITVLEAAIKALDGNIIPIDFEKIKKENTLYTKGVFSTTEEIIKEVDSLLNTRPGLSSVS